MVWFMAYNEDFPYLRTNMKNIVALYCDCSCIPTVASIWPWTASNRTSKNSAYPSIFLFASTIISFRKHKSSLFYWKTYGTYIKTQVILNARGQVHEHTSELSGGTCCRADLRAVLTLVLQPFCKWLYWFPQRRSITVKNNNAICCLPLNTTHGNFISK